ncbi:ribosome recycling factor [Echinicola soli]|uniref:Ribosome recycling factor n=1 Tax=Echinicola soli TaxID=2591634 RepID=A0A514CK08_9BACT|nr:ribosome recycling factor [Echinicola soli]
MINSSFECENGKISIRSARKEPHDSLKKLQIEGLSEDDVKRAEDKVQKLTDEFSSKIDVLFEKKEADIMNVYFTTFALQKRATDA